MSIHGRDRMQKLVRALRKIVHGFFHPYRPEKHYMRGPRPGA